MSRAIDLRVLELLAAKLCHDLIGPVSAVGNGAELLAEEDPEFVKDAVALVGDSARKANRRLQFYRFAYGFGGGGLTGPAPHQLVTGFFAESAIQCSYGTTVQALAPERQKLACLMLAAAADGLPRGGRLLLDLGAAGPDVEASGEGSGPSPEWRAALALAAPVAELTTRIVGAYFAGLVAETQRLRLVVAVRPNGFHIATAALT